jgi:hypothetical protein
MSVGGTQLEHYYSSMNAVSSSQAKAAAAYSASPYYEYLNVGSAAAYHPGQGPSALLQPNATAAVVALGNGVQHQVNSRFRRRRVPKFERECECDMTDNNYNSTCTCHKNDLFLPGLAVHVLH